MENNARVCLFLNAVPGIPRISRHSLVRMENICGKNARQIKGERIQAKNKNARKKKPRDSERAGANETKKSNGSEKESPNHVQLIFHNRAHVIEHKIHSIILRR